MKIPSVLIAGDSAQWDDDPCLVNGVRATSADYALTYSLRGPATLDLTGAANGNGWRTSITPTQAAGLPPGAYWWSAALTATGQRITVGRGEFSVAANLASVIAPGYDGRSVAEIAMADAEAALANLTASGQRMKSYSIGSRTAQYYTAVELIAAISYWRIRVKNERAASQIAQGLGDPRNLNVRFTG